LCPGRGAARSDAPQTRDRKGDGVRYGPGSAVHRFASASRCTASGTRAANSRTITGKSRRTTMLSAKDIGGLMAMMPAFATDNAADIRATSTVDVGRLHHGLDRMIRDGANVIATTG